MVAQARLVRGAVFLKIRETVCRSRPIRSSGALERTRASGA